MVRHGAGCTAKSSFKLGSLLRPYRRGGKTTYPELSAESHDALLASIRSNFPETFVGDTKAVLGLVMRVATPLIANKRRQLWEANKASILPMIREAMPPCHSRVRTLLHHYATESDFREISSGDLVH